MNTQASFRGDPDSGRFCIRGCSQGVPAAADVVVLDSTRQALMDGYLPCTVCQPMTAGFDPEKQVAGLLEEVSDNTLVVLKDQALRERGIDPANLRLWFQKFHQMTFQDYLRLQRVNSLFGTVNYEAGDDRTETPQDTIVVTRLSTPLGPMLAGASRTGLCLLEFMDRRMLETQLRRLEKYFGSDLDIGASRFFDVLNQQLQEYFSGERTSFSVPLDVPGTPFQRRAWDALMTIPFGETRAYQDQAVAIGQPSAVRAVARANGDNRIAIVIPCHRVIGKDGSLTGYGGKLWRKQRLLELEGAIDGDQRTLF